MVLSFNWHIKVEYGCHLLGKLGLKGIEGAFRNWKGEFLYMFLCSICIAYSNLAKIVALKKAIDLTIEKDSLCHTRLNF